MEASLLQADDGDIEKLIEIEQSVVKNKIYHPMLSRDEWLVALQAGQVYLIMVEGVAVGSIGFENKKDGVVHISGLVVSPSYQGKGFEKQAMDELLEKLKDAKRVDLVTHPKNKKALRLYQSLGFVLEKEMQNYYGDGQPRVMLILGQSPAFIK